MAGREFYKALVPESGDFSFFLKNVQNLLKDLKIGVLRVEKADMDQLRFTMTVAEDLDCSGLDVCDETICTYDEGFLAGLLGAYTGTKFKAVEVDCWCSGRPSLPVRDRTDQPVIGLSVTVAFTF